MPKLPLMRCQFLIADLLSDIGSPTGSLPEKHSCRHWRGRAYSSSQYCRQSYQTRRMRRAGSANDRYHSGLLHNPNLLDISNHLRIYENLFLLGFTTLLAHICC